MGKLGYYILGFTSAIFIDFILFIIKKVISEELKERKKLFISN